MVNGSNDDNSNDTDNRLNGSGLSANHRKLLLSKISSASIPTPSDPKLRNAPCPICLEKFESTWAEADQDWIWRDARLVGNRVFHASCYAEVHEGNDREQEVKVNEEDGREESAKKKRKREENEDEEGKEKGEKEQKGLES